MARQDQGNAQAGGRIRAPGVLAPGLDLGSAARLTTKQEPWKGGPTPLAVHAFPLPTREYLHRSGLLVCGQQVHRPLHVRRAWA